MNPLAQGGNGEANEGIAMAGATVHAMDLVRFFETRLTMVDDIPVPGLIALQDRVLASFFHPARSFPYTTFSPYRGFLEASLAAEENHYTGIPVGLRPVRFTLLIHACTR
jgi:hypothetical protein